MEKVGSTPSTPIKGDRYIGKGMFEKTSDP